MKNRSFKIKDVKRPGLEATEEEGLVSPVSLIFYLCIKLIIIDIMSYKSSIPSQSIEDILKKIDGAIVLDPAILSLTSSSTSTTISNAVGGPSGFTEILNSLRGGGLRSV